MNLYLEKIAEANPEGHGRAFVRGARAYGRGFVEGFPAATIGSALGALPGAIKRNPYAVAAGGVIGGNLAGLAAFSHGTGRSVQNQIAEEKLKQAAFDELVEQGLDPLFAETLV